ncbi:MAG: hypothetical protein IJL40_05580 [Oscillospiraceae bacterium]|nr:hypothetical protein [Oscillospiraceae bacterium]
MNVYRELKIALAEGRNMSVVTEFKDSEGWIGTDLTRTVQEGIGAIAPHFVGRYNTEEEARELVARIKKAVDTVRL